VKKKKHQPSRKDAASTDVITFPDAIAFISGGSAFLDAIAPLWKKQALLHAGFSPHFADDFRNRTFFNRKKELLAKAHHRRIHVILAIKKSTRSLVGYAVGTINSLNVAEVDSLFVEKRFRRAKIGTLLMVKMLQWFDSHHTEAVTVTVATGNESAFPFYRRFGFFPRVTTLMFKKAI
jgi:GNAT superfamily N-acetyltransferase